MWIATIAEKWITYGMSSKLYFVIIIKWANRKSMTDNLTTYEIIQELNTLCSFAGNFSKEVLIPTLLLLPPLSPPFSNPPF